MLALASEGTTADMNKNSCRSPLTLSRSSRSRRWRHSGTGTAVIVVTALLISTTAWLSLVFSGTTSRCWHRFKHWETLSSSRKHRSSSSLHQHQHHHHHHEHLLDLVPPPPPHRFSFRNRSLSEEEEKHRGSDNRLTLNHLMFGIAGSSQLWKRRKEFVRLWWRPNEMRGHVWLEEQIVKEDWDESLPPIMISEDTSHFRYTNPTGHPSGLRISRILSESFRLGLPDVRWFVLGDDDTIFNADNLVSVLSKYESSEMVYIGAPSESHSANTYFSHAMAYGGGGIAISYSLAEAVSSILDDCLERYHKLYGSDDRLHACISELGIPLSRELGFHQWDIRGSAHGLLSSHPVAPFISIHHVEAVDPIYPGLSLLDSLKLFTRAMNADPLSFLQRSICYDHVHHLSFSVSLGYVIQVFPNIELPHSLDRAERTYSAWNKISHRHEFDLDTRDPHKSICKRPVLFFLKDIARQGNATLGSYVRAKMKDDLKRKVFCFPRSPPLPYVEIIQVLGHSLTDKWHLVPRRLCCKLDRTSDELLTISVGQCGKGSSGERTFGVLTKIDLMDKGTDAVDELKQYPGLRAEVSNAAIESLERMREESRKATLQLVDMECCYLTVEFFRKVPQDIEKGGNPTHSIFNRYNDSYLRRVGSNVLAYVNMVCGSLRNSIPKSVLHCQVREAKRSLLDHFFAVLGKKEAKRLANLLNKDPAVMQRRTNLAKRLELYRSAQSEIDAVAWAK